MTKKYLVWDFDTQTRSDALRIEADSAERAAREYSEQCYWEDRNDSREVAVATLGAEKAAIFSVDIEVTLDSYAMKSGTAPIERDADTTEVSP